MTPPRHRGTDSIVQVRVEWAKFNSVPGPVLQINRPPLMRRAQSELGGSYLHDHAHSRLIRPVAKPRSG
jgi:hypothetical protein